VGDLGAGVYHTFGMEWLEDDYVGFYFDGQLVRSFGDNAAIAQMQSMYLIFNYAVGGWPGSPSLAQWPQGHTDDYKVDWVRVWQKNVAKTTTLIDPQDDGVADWSDNAAWTSGAPSQAEHNATLGPQATAAQRLDWSGIKTLGSLRFAGATSHTVGNGDESILFARDQATGVASLIVEAGSVAQIVNSRVETWSNLTIRNDSAARLSLFGEIHSQGPDASSGILTFGGSGEVYLGAAVRQRSDTSLRDNSRVILARGFYQSPVVEANATLRISDGSALVVRTLHSPVITGEPTTGSSLGFLGPGRDRLVLNNGTLEVLASTSTARGFTIGVGGATLAPSSGGTLQFLRPVALGSDTVQALGGNLNLGGAGIGVFDKILPGAGGVRKFGTSVWTLSNQNTYAGPTVVEAGQLRVDGATGSGATSVAAGALLTGSGLIRGALQVSGEIRPDGQLSVGGAATLSAAALLRVGVAAGGAVDRLSVAGLFDPTGATFQLDFDAGYAPQAGEQYDVIDAASWSGQFTQLSLPQLSASFTWDLADFSTQGVLSIGLAGDYNRDGQVDAADYAVWRDAADAGATSLPNRVTGGVGVIGQADYFAWATNFGASVSQLVRQGALIPEAAAARMALLSIAFFAALARR
jgi:autotransporter-associated beta strand protein